MEMNELINVIEVLFVEQRNNFSFIEIYQFTAAFFRESMSDLINWEMAAQFFSGNPLNYFMDFAKASIDARTDD